jgi:hypothetical protein
MNFSKMKWVAMILLVVACALTMYTFSTPKSVYAQQPTGSIPTVTGTPSGPMAKVKMGVTTGNSINVRAGPNTLFEIVGIVQIGQLVPVIGKTAGGDWLLIESPGVPGGTGWVYSSFMDITAGEIPLAESPPEALPKVTVTIDPALAAQFVTTPLATPLPTYTPVVPLLVPTFEVVEPQVFAGIPIGLIIIGLFGAGLLTALFSYFQTR